MGEARGWREENRVSGRRELMKRDGERTEWEERHAWMFL